MSQIFLEPAQFLYALVAISGGVARYLSSFTHGKPFKFSIFIASAFVSGFSGWMFAQMGLSLDMPQGIVFMMAGVGGFMGEQNMKFVVEYVQRKVKV